jgi:hypothetical protein
MVTLLSVIGMMKIKKAPKRKNIPLEPSHGHLMATPPSHFTPQKVKGFVVG